jgi:cytochrome d ubiquinol oxidase subunit I
VLDNLTAAREQMAFSLGFHIVFAVFGMGLPWLLLFVGGAVHPHRRPHLVRDGPPLVQGVRRPVRGRRGQRHRAVVRVRAAVADVHGALRRRVRARVHAGAFAFFLEAIFLGLYLYGWDRLPPAAHWWTGVPVAVSGMASALFVTTANAWMNTPVGFVEENRLVVSAEPIAPLIAPASAAPGGAHDPAGVLCTGFGVARVRVAMLRSP